MSRPASWMGISLRLWSLGILTLQFSAFILLLHYSRVMPSEDGQRYLPSTAVFLVELLKLAVCGTVSLYQISNSIPRSMPATSMFSALGNAIFAGDSWKMAIPAFLYTLSNSLQYLGISNLNAATYQVVYQLKIFVTALLSSVMLRKSINARQWISLISLMFGVAVVSLSQEEDTMALNHHTVYVPRTASFKRDIFRIAAGVGAISRRSATYEGIEEDEIALYGPAIDTSFGLLAVVGVCIFSALAGVYFEKVLKDSPKPSLWIRNSQMSLYSLCPSLFIGVIFIDGPHIAQNGFFCGYNEVVVLSIILNAFGGILVAFCLYYGDNISKNFATSLSMVISSFASFLFFDFSASTSFIIGTAIVVGATCLYSMQASSPRVRPPSIKLQSYEKTSTIEIPEEEFDTSIKLPKTPLRAEEGSTTSRPGSPGHKKRIKDSMGYFTKIQD